MKSVWPPLVKLPTKTPTIRAVDAATASASGDGSGEKPGGPDATSEFRRQESLVKTGALQDAIFKSAYFSYIATDEQGVIQIFNVGAERMLGYTAAEVMNRITPADISDPQEVIARAAELSLELGTPITPGFEALVFKASRGIEDIYELTYFRKDGSRFPAVVSVTALRDAQDAIIGYLLIGTDNTARKQAEEALLKAGALQSAIFNSANFSSIATDANGVIQIFNVGAERMLGYTAAEVMNKITPADISDPQEVIARAAELSVEFGTPITPGFEALVFKASRGIEDIYELTYFRKDGSRFPAIVSVTALRDAHKDILGYLLIGTDNTARKQIEADRALLDQRLRDQQFYTRSLIESNIDALVTTDPQGIISDVNQQMMALTGRTRDELIGAPWRKFFTDPVRADTAIKRVLAEKKVSNYELTVRALNGEETVVSYNAATIHDRDRKLQGVFAAARDVTERKQAAEKLGQLNADLEQRVIHRTTELAAANKELEAFSYSVAHDLRTPLRSMDGFALVLLEDYGNKLDEEGKDALERIRAASQRMGNLIDDMLRLSQVTRVDLRVTQVDLSALAREIAAGIEREHSVRNVEWAIEAGLSIRADPALMRIAMQNLLENAWKFTGRTDRPVIRIGALTRDANKVYFVADNGVGFDMAHADNLFGAFQRLHHADDFTGTGIGLAIVQRILHRHNGKIWAEAKQGEGATLFFSVEESEHGSNAQVHPAG